VRQPRITEFVSALGRADPAAVAIVDRGREVTYRELDGMAGRMAVWLEAQGLRPGEMVGVTIRADHAHLVATLGLMRLGCDQIGLASLDAPAMRAELARRVGAAAVLGDRAEDAIAGIGLIRPDEAAIAATPEPAPDRFPTPGPDGTTVLMPSSGTTGRPKLVPLSERLLRIRGLLRMGAAERRHSPIPLEFGQARWSLLMTLGAGGCWVCHNDGQHMPLTALVRRHGVTTVTVSPRRAEALLHEAPRTGGWPAGAGLHLAGAPVPGALRRRLQEGLTRDLYVVYGATECSICAVAMPEDHARHPDGVGRPWSASVAVVDEEGRRLPPGRQGVLRVLAAGRAEGYLDEPDATARAFLAGGWYHTGDVATVSPDGHVIFGGRADDMMILGTINIFPAEIERAAEGFPGLAECAAFALRLDAHGDVPMLAAVPAGPGALDAAALLAHCRARLGLRAPRKVVVVPALPRNGAGKVVRGALAALAAGEPVAPC